MPGFDMVGAKKHKKIMQQAIKLVFGEKIPNSTAQRRGALRKLSKSDKIKLEKLGDNFIDLLNLKSQNLAVLSGKYVKKHQDQFIKEGGGFLGLFKK